MKKLYKTEDIKKLKIDDVRQLYKKYVSPSQTSALGVFGFGKDIIENAKGNWLYTQNKVKILDFTGGYGVLNHGHNHPKIIKARINFQNENRMEIHKNYLSQYTAALSANIANLLPEDLNKVYLPNSGAEANEGAIKIAYKYFNGKKKYLLHSDISFHGKLLGTGSISGSPESNFKFPGLTDTDKFEYGNIKSVKEKIKEYKNNIFAIIVEPFSASSLRNLSEKFLFEIRHLCNQENIILIFDEVFTGWGKTGELFYFMHYEDLVPDILTFSKSFGGGKSSISGYTVRDKLYEKSYDTLNSFNLHSTTYNAFGEENITALEAINIIIEDNYLSKSKNIGIIIKDNLIKLKHRYPNLIEELRGVGALQGFKLNTKSLVIKKISNFIPLPKFDKSRFIDKLCYASIVNNMYKEHKILTSFSLNKDICLWVSPSLITNEEEIEIFFKALNKTLEKGLNKLVFNLLNSKFFNYK